MSQELEKKIQILQSYSDDLEKNYYVRRLGIFGSFSKNSQTRKSDIDILVEFQKPVGFFTFFKLEKFLEKVLQSKVDLVTRNALKPSIKKQVLDETIYVQTRI